MRLLFVFLSRALILLVAFWVFRWLLRVLVGGGPGADRPSSTPPPIGELKRDPVCGTYVATQLSVKTHRGDQELHFCSPECQQEYLRDNRERPPD